MKLLKNNLDEMQEHKLLKIEHNGFWFAFWSLLASIFIQLTLFEEYTIRSIAGEWIILLCLCIYMSVSCMKNGIWDRRLKPNGKTNLIVSLVSSLVSGVILFVSSYVKFHSLLVSAAVGAFMFLMVFILTLLFLSLSIKLYYKKISKIETKCEE